MRLAHSMKYFIFVETGLVTGAAARNGKKQAPELNMPKAPRCEGMPGVSCAASYTSETIPQDLGGISGRD